MRSVVWKRLCGAALAALILGHGAAEARPKAADKAAKSDGPAAPAPTGDAPDCSSNPSACDEAPDPGDEAASDDAAVPPAQGYTDKAPPVDASFGAAWLGAEHGDVTLVVFVDYACGGCREAQAVIDRLLAEDPGLKVVFRVLVNEEEGREAALVSLAVARAGGDWAKFHRALDAGGDPTREHIDGALAAAGFDKAKLPVFDPPGSETSVLLNELYWNDDDLRQLDTGFVPTWLVAGTPAQSPVDYEKIKAAIASARKAAHRT